MIYIYSECKVNSIVVATVDVAAVFDVAAAAVVAISTPDQSWAELDVSFWLDWDLLSIFSSDHTHSISRSLTIMTYIC